jgi:adenosine 3'-phospho 5'-phosphosulfate transporter B2
VKSVLSKQKTASGKKKLLVYDVRDGWEPLCSFLDCAVPESEFPSVLNVPYFPSDETDQGRQFAHDDTGHEFEDMLVADSKFGLTMRTELRKGLATFAAVFTSIAMVVIGMLWFSVGAMPVAFLALAYLAIMVTGWTAYVVVHGLVLKVPALVVLPMAMKSLLIALCLQACFITYGILKEMIVTRDRIASPVLIMSARLMSVVCGCVVMLLTEGRVSFGGASLWSFSAFGFTNEASTWAGYEMLKYVSFPVQVMAKSCKLLPNMIMGRVLNGTRYEWSQYFQAVGAMVCVTIMHLADEKDHKKKGKGGAVDEDEMSDMMKTMMGVGLLVLFFAFDSFTSQWQTAIYKKHPKITQTQMMLAGNIVGVAVSMISVLSRWTTVSKSLSYAFANPDVMGRILLLGLSGALGQFCIYTAIKVLGPLAFTWIMTSRQLFSVLISLVMFGHGVSVTKLGCILTVFAIMSSKQLARAVPHAMKYCGCKGEKSNGKSRLPSRLIMRRPTTLWSSPAEKED